MDDLVFIAHDSRDTTCAYSVLLSEGIFGGDQNAPARRDNSGP
jgi:hypothetical protein